MRLSFALVLLLPALASAQPTAEQKKETVKWVTNLQAPDGGFYVAPPSNTDARPVPSLRAVNGAVRALKYLGAELPNKEKHAAFVLKCYDPKTGAFAEPGGKPDVAITSIGVMAAAELGIPHEKYAKAMDYLKENAKTFEEVRIAAAAVEAWGVKDCPFKLDAWEKAIMFDVDIQADVLMALIEPEDGGARMLGSYDALVLRLGFRTKKSVKDESLKSLRTSQLADGGWCKKGVKVSDIETTYRVMRAFMLLKEKPKDVKKLHEFLDAHRNKDGGYATKPGDKSSMSGVYYCIIVSKWLDDLERK